MNRGAKTAGTGRAKHPFGNSKGIEDPIHETKSATNSIGRPGWRGAEFFCISLLGRPQIFSALLVSFDFLEVRSE